MTIFHQFSRAPRSVVCKLGRRLLALILTALALAGCGRGSSEPSIATRSQKLVVTDGLVAAYDFDEGSGTTAPDISGSGNTGTLSGATWTSSGRRGTALSFDGVDDRVIVPDSTSLDLTSGMTLMAWVKPAPGESNWATVMQKEREEGLVYGLYSSDSDGAPNAWVRTNGDDVSIYGDHHALRTDRWTHVAATYDGSTFTFYVNGKVESTANVSGAIETSSGVLSIGGNAIWGDWLHGLIDEIRVYGRGLSHNEVTLEMSGLSRGPAPELVAAFNFDEGAGTVAGDASGSSNTGVLSGPAWSTAGKNGGALSFDGFDDRVIVEDAASLDLTYGMTLMAWVNPVSLEDGWRTVILKEGHAFDLAYALYATGLASPPPAGYINHEGTEVDSTASSALPLGVWTHLATSYDDVTLNLYINGELAATRPHDGDILETGRPIGIGGNAVWPNEFFDGLIDDVRIYNNGLSQAEIVADMNTPVGGTSGCGSGCDDGNACNGVETCVNGSCVAGTPVTCTAQDQCHDVGTCDPATGVCSNPTKPDGSACPDATVCNGGETCQSGACVAGTPPPTNDGNPCTIDACDPVTGVNHTPVAAGTSCSDFDLCNGSELCDAAAVCQPGTPVSTEDGNPCTTGSCNPATGVVTQTPLPTGTECFLDVCTLAECNAAGECTAAGSTVIDDGDPCTIEWCDPILGPQAKSCSTLDRTVGTTLHESMKWLYEGANPPQIGVASATIEVKRAAALHGVVRTRDGSVLPGAKVTILDHPEFGYTWTHADGAFELVVNGGGKFVVDFSRDGYLTVQRAVETVWGEHSVVPQVVMIPPDPVVTPIDLVAPSEDFQVARGSVQTDADGSRQGTLLVPAGVLATMHFPDGSTTELSSMNVRITEFTVGETGPSAMPGDLPPESRYTYSFEVNADEAVTAGADEIMFDMPLIYYVENFLGFPAGIPVPHGAYDRETSEWEADESGIVMDIVGETGGLADVDVTGDGIADTGAALDTHGITDAERERLAELYDAGDSLWRSMLMHFTRPWDCNWGGGPPPDATPPTGDPPEGPDCDDCCPAGAGPTGVNNASGIQCDSQTLSESLPIAGTPYTLNYSSRRMPDRIDERRIRIPLSAGIPSSLMSIQLEISVAGRTFVQEFPALPNQETIFVWDGLDKFGRPTQGAQRATITRRFMYPLGYTGCAKFGYNGNGLDISGDLERGDVSINDVTNLPVSTVDARLLGLGGWTLDAHHVSELADRRLELGTGQRLDARVLAPVAELVSVQEGGVGDAVSANSLVVSPDGTVFSGGGSMVFRTPSGGVPARIIGTAGNEGGYAGDGLPSTDPSVRINGLKDLAVGRDGSLYIAEEVNHIVRRVGPDGIMGTFAGTGTVPGYSGDGGQASLALLRAPHSLAIAPGGSVFIAEVASIRRVEPDGTISTVAGLGFTTFGYPLHPDDGTVAAEIRFEPGAIAVAPDGALYAAALTACNGDALNPAWRIFRFADGLVYWIAGGCGSDPSDGLPAKDTRLVVEAMTFDHDGRLYFVDFTSSLTQSIRTINVSDGTINTVVKRSNATRLKPGMPLTAVLIGPTDVAIGPNGLYGSGTRLGTGSGAPVVFRAASPIPVNTGGPFELAGRDGTSLYGFDALGRHLGTRHSLTGAPLQTFGYDSRGQLVTVADSSNLVTSIERDTSGRPIAIVSPFGQRTELDLDTNGWLSRVIDPEGNETAMTYTPGGLLKTFRNARGFTGTMTYDAIGRLETDVDPALGSHTLVRTEDGQTTTVERTTALGRKTRYVSTDVGPASRTLSVTDPADNRLETATRPDRSVQADNPDGTVVTTTENADDRFGINAPTAASIVSLPSGLTKTETTGRSYVALNPTNPLDFQSYTDATSTNGRIWQTHYSTETRTFTSTSPQGRQTFRFIDPQGRTTRTQVGNLLPVDFIYDAQGRLDHVTQGTRTTQNAYFPTGDAAGYLQSITDATGVPTTFTRDSLGRTLTETRAAATTSFSWDPLSNLATVTPPSKPIHEMTYTPVNLLESYEPPPAGLPVSATGYTYDLDRMLRTETRPGGVSIVRTPDSAGRLDTVAIPGGLVDYDYFPPSAPSGAGKVSSIAGPYGVDLSFTYDGALTTSTSWSGDVTGSVAWQYNNDFQKILETVSGATGTAQTAFGYDADMLLTCASPTTCSPPGTDALRLTRSPQHGMVTGISLGQTSETWSYNAYGELARQTASFNGSPLVDIIYDAPGAERDQLGRIVRKTETILGVTKVYEYRYDALRRLDQVKIDGVVDEEFTYDANGNRLTYFKQGVGTVSATYDDQDRLLTYGTFVFTYTANGEMETKTNTATSETWLFQYDALGNLVSVGLPNGDLVEYLVDGMGRRVGKKKNGVLLKQWIYRDALKPVAELDGAGNLVSEFVYGTKRTVPEYVVRGGATFRVVSDQLGSPLYAVNVANSGDVPFGASYTGFGYATGTGLDWMPFGFAGGAYDPDTKFVRFGARDYEPVAGRWTSKDPVRYRSQELNFFVYALSDPVNSLDPTGLDACSWTLGVGCGLSCMLVGLMVDTPAPGPFDFACLAWCSLADFATCEPPKPPPPSSCPAAPPPPPPVPGCDPSIASCM